MHPSKKSGRFAGILYLLGSIPAVVALQYVPGRLIVSGDPAATASNILNSEALFRFGIICELLSSIIFIFMVRALYRLFINVDKSQASLMATFFLLSVPISFLNVLNSLAALALFRGTGYLSIVDKQQLNALGMSFLSLHGKGIDVAAIFWGLWLLPFGLLVIKSRLLPRVLGVLLIAACFGYLADSFTSLLLPVYAGRVHSFAAVAEGVGELPIMAWLLVRGISERKRAIANAS